MICSFATVWVVTLTYQDWSWVSRSRAECRSCTQGLRLASLSPARMHQGRACCSASRRSSSGRNCTPVSYPARVPFPAGTLRELEEGEGYEHGDIKTPTSELQRHYPLVAYLPGVSSIFSGITFNPKLYLGDLSFNTFSGE